MNGMCGKKRRWERYEEAAKAFTRAWEAKDTRIRPTAIYACDTCDGYHLTSKTTAAIRPGSKLRRRHRR